MTGRGIYVASATDLYQKVLQRRTQQAAVPLTVDIYDWYQELQAAHAVYFDAERASWLVLRYDDVMRVVQDHATFSSQRTTRPDGSVDSIASGGILGMDPPRHHQLRSLITQAFSPRMMTALEPRITAIVHSLLDQVSGAGAMDIVDDLAFPLPITIAAELLGVPSEDRDQFRQWSADYVGADFALRLATAQKIAGYFQALIAERRQQPREDLITHLVMAELDGERLPEQDILGTCLLLLVAGHETTTGLISNAIVCLDEHPDALRELMAQPALLPQAIEEVLRYRAVVHTIPRVATKDTLFAGRHIEAGDLVLPLYAAANLDPAQFPNPNQFDIHRTPNRHLGFGYGIHFCLGAPLARLETRIALGALLERFGSIQRVRSAPLELKPSSFIYGLKHVPIIFQG
jgi:cytochrome P450